MGQVLVLVQVLPLARVLARVLETALLMVWAVDMAPAPATTPVLDAAVVTSPALAVTTAPVAVMVLAKE